MFWANVTGTAFPITLYMAVMFFGESSMNRKLSGNDCILATSRIVYLRFSVG